MPLRQIPTLDPAKTDGKTIEAIKILHAIAGASWARLDTLSPKVADLLDRPYPLTIRQIKALLEYAGGQSALNVSGLAGILAQPQAAGVPLLTEFPSVTASDNGRLVNVNGILYYFDALTTDPGQWIPIAANAAIIIDTHANRLALYNPAVQPVGELFFENDRDALYAITNPGTGNVWTFLMARPMQDVLANRPADLGADDEGFTFIVTDADFRVDYWDGAAWSTFPWSTPGGVSVFQTLVAGGAAGDFTVAGIDVGMTLVSVLYHVGAGLVVTDIQDLTSEFTITAPNTINNAGGTDTTGGKLQVLWTNP